MIDDKDIIDRDFREVPDSGEKNADEGDAADKGQNEITPDEVNGDVKNSSVSAGTWKTREEDTDDEEKRHSGHYCMMCHRPESSTGKQIELPGGMYICTDCMQKGFEAIQNPGMN